MASKSLQAMLQILKILQKRCTIVRFSTSPISAKIGLNNRKKLQNSPQNDTKIAMLVATSAILAPTCTQVALKIDSNSKSWALLAGIWLESRRPGLQDCSQELPRPSPGHNFHKYCHRKSFNSVENLPIQQSIFQHSLKAKGPAAEALAIKSAAPIRRIAAGVFVTAPGTIRSRGVAPPPQPGPSAAGIFF